MNAYQFWLQFLPVLGTFITTIVMLFRQQSNHAEQKEMNADVKTTTEAVLVATNGMSDKLVAAAKLQGASDEREHPTQPF
jgi:hypothetical protein